MTPSLVLDTNLAVLLFVGLSGAENIKRHKRLQTYDETDFELVAELVNRSAGLLLCPNVVSETSNLIRYMSDPIRSEVVQLMSMAIQNFDEIYVPSLVATRRPEYLRLGATDAVLLELVGQGAALLTDDLDLYTAAISLSPNVVNFNHLRGARRDF